MWDLIQLGVALALVFLGANRAWIFSLITKQFKRTEVPVEPVTSVQSTATVDPKKQLVIDLGRAAWEWDQAKIDSLAWAIHQPHALEQLAEAYRTGDSAAVAELQKRLNSRLVKPKDVPAEDGERSGKR